MAIDFESGSAVSRDPRNDPLRGKLRENLGTAEEANEAPEKLGDPTYGRTRVLQRSRLEAVPTPPASVQPAAPVLYTSAGSGKTSALLRTMRTSGAPPKTIADRISPPVIRRRGRPRDHLVIHQRWEGYVEALKKTGFEALLIDLAERPLHEERTQIDFDEVSAFDRNLIQPGAVFYWSMGYRVRPSGQREGLSVIRFRRLPTWTPEELDLAERAAKETAELFGWNLPNSHQNDEDRVG